MTEKDWFERFTQHRNAVFTKEDFDKYKKGILKGLKYYEKYLPKGSKILELGCGLGFRAVPLSSLGYKVVGIDSDRRVVEAAKKNAENFGGGIKIIEGDISNIDNFFQKDSFDACISAGVLEHFDEEEVRKLVNLQLKLAPLVIAIMPLKHEVDHDKVHVNFWSEEEWVNTVLKNYNIVEHFIESHSNESKKIRLLYLFIKRKVAPTN